MCWASQARRDSCSRARRLCEEEHWTAMHVMFDNSDNNEEPLAAEREAVLVSMYHSSHQNYLLVSLPCSQLHSSPSIETRSGDLPGLAYQCGVQLDLTQDALSQDTHWYTAS